MARIELPKDAEGREIPLDTKVLYMEDGTNHRVNSFIFNRIDAEWSVETHIAIYDTEELYLTPPDSWERLEEDLDSCSVSTQYAPCAYFSDSTGSCEKCPANPHEECLVQMVKHITLRIRKLRDED